MIEIEVTVILPDGKEVRQTFQYPETPEEYGDLDARDFVGQIVIDDVQEFIIEALEED